MTAQFSAREMVTVAGKSLVGLTHQGKRVVTLNQIDDVHARKKGTAKDNFNRNKKHFTVQKDFFLASNREAMEYGFIAPRGLVLLTESGYLMIAKTFTDDLSWQVQRQLVDTYFHAKNNTIPTPKNPTPLDYLNAVHAVLHDHDASLKSHSDKIAELQDTRRLEHWQALKLQDAVHAKVREISLANDVEDLRPVYLRVWRNLKHEFRVPRYNEIPAVKYDEALKHVQGMNIKTLAGIQ